MKTWRDQIRPIIAEIAAEVGMDDEKKFREACRERYPFEKPPWGHVYKIWLSEIRIQLGKAKFGQRKYQPPPKEQMSFLEDK